jgi:hypothetical protein
MADHPRLRHLRQHGLEPLADERGGFDEINGLHAGSVPAAAAPLYRRRLNRRLEREFPTDQAEAFYGGPVPFPGFDKSLSEQSMCSALHEDCAFNSPARFAMS